MTDDTTADVYRALVKVGEFLKKAKPEHIKSLLNGDARLEIVPADWKVTPPPAPKAPRPPAKPKVQQPSAHVVEEQLRALRGTEQATNYLTGLGLNVTQTRKLATDLGLRGTKQMQADEVIELIVRTFVGSRLDSEALQRL
jgi:hypothetical protein